MLISQNARKKTFICYQFGCIIREPKWMSQHGYQPAQVDDKAHKQQRLMFAIKFPITCKLFGGNIESGDGSPSWCFCYLSLVPDALLSMHYSIQTLTSALQHTVRTGAPLYPCIFPFFLFSFLGALHWLYDKWSIRISWWFVVEVQGCVWYIIGNECHSRKTLTCHNSTRDFQLKFIISYC